MDYTPASYQLKTLLSRSAPQLRSPRCGRANLKSYKSLTIPPQNLYCASRFQIRGSISRYSGKNLLLSIGQLQQPNLFILGIAFRRSGTLARLQSTLLDKYCVEGRYFCAINVMHYTKAPKSQYAAVLTGSWVRKRTRRAGWDKEL